MALENKHTMLIVPSQTHSPPQTSGFASPTYNSNPSSHSWYTIYQRSFTLSSNYPKTECGMWSSFTPYH